MKKWLGHGFVLNAALLIGCGDGGNRVGGDFQVVPKDSVLLVKTGSVLLPVKDTFLTFLRPVVLDDSLIYAYRRDKQGTLAKFSLKNQRFVENIKLKDTVASTEKFNNFYLKSVDSIFVVSSNFPSISLFDSKGNKVGYWSFPSLNSPDLKPRLGPYFLPQYYPFYDSKEDRFFMTLVPPFFPSQGGFESEPLQRVYSLNESTVELKFAPAEGIMKKKEKKIYPPDLSFPYVLIKDIYAYVSYPMDHFIYVYNNSDGCLINKKPVYAAGLVSFPGPRNADDQTDAQASWNFRITLPFYEALIYHAKARLFSRVVHFPQELKLEDGRLNDGKKRKAILLILDEALNIVGRHDFEGGSMPVHGLVGLSDGVLVLRKEIDSASYYLPSEKYVFSIK